MGARECPSMVKQTLSAEEAGKLPTYIEVPALEVPSFLFDRAPPGTGFPAARFDEFLKSFMNRPSFGNLARAPRIVILLHRT
jgi:hypothetical protein